jgi:tetratricopeptide (TPR) repeat protein
MINTSLRDRSQHSMPSAAMPNPDRERGGGCYDRKQVCRLLKIEGRQLKSWERQQLIPELVEYRFSDLLSLKTIVRLRAENCRPRAIREALDALRIRLHDLDGLTDVRVYKDGGQVRVQIGKQKMEAVSGQLLFDFNEFEINKLLQLPVAQKTGTAVAERFRNKLEADRWFERGLELEQIGAPFEQIIEAYQKAAELDPNSAGALVNLGTVFFNGHAWADAEEQYRKALEIDPQYPLAHFNLANLFDERGDSALALQHYHEALKLHPRYADAHYNLALLYQGLSDMLNALRHWRAYLRLDSSSAWAQVARRELQKLESLTVIEGSRARVSKLELARENALRTQV